MGFGPEGVKEFIKLDDTPASYAGQSGKVAAVNAGEDALEFIAAAAGAATFLDLTDTPASYTNQDGLLIGVNHAEDALEFTRGIGFDKHYTITYDPDPQLDSPKWYSDEIKLMITGLNHRIAVESTEMYTWQAWQSLSLYFSAVKGDRTATKMQAFFGMNRGLPDIIDHPEYASIGVYLYNNRWYAQNGDGSNYTRTVLGDYTTGYPMPFKIVRSADDIKWYRNGVLKATHTTNIPVWTFGFKEHYSAKKNDTYPGSIVCQHIKYFSGIFP